ALNDLQLIVERMNERGETKSEAAEKIKKLNTYSSTLNVSGVWVAHDIAFDQSRVHHLMREPDILVFDFLHILFSRTSILPEYSSGFGSNIPFLTSGLTIRNYYNGNFGSIVMHPSTGLGCN
ncbi:hypothetical protein Tco_0862013, partial [Tanacetum coccineum]